MTVEIMVPSFRYIFNRQAVALLCAVVVFSEANSAVAGCGDYLHVKGKPVHSMDAANDSAPDDSVALFHAAHKPNPIEFYEVDSRHQPSPCSQGNCNNDHQPSTPPAAPPQVDVEFEQNGINVGGLRHRDAQMSRIRLKDSAQPANHAPSIDRPPK